MWTAMAVHASGSLAVASLHGLTVKAAIVGGLLVGMARRTGNLLWSGFVRGVLHVGVAIHAGKHAAVDGIFEGLGINMQADGLSVDVVGQRGVAVAGQAFLCSWFWGLLTGSVDSAGSEEPGSEEQGEGNSERKNIPCCSRGHAPTRRSFRIELIFGGRVEAVFHAYLAKLRMWAIKPLMSASVSLPP